MRHILADRATIKLYLNYFMIWLEQSQSTAQTNGDFQLMQRGGVSVKILRLILTIFIFVRFLKIVFDKTIKIISPRSPAHRRLD